MTCSLGTSRKPVEVIIQQKAGKEWTHQENGENAGDESTQQKEMEQ
jgi:hypothetical protein